MDTLDLVLIVACIGFAISGYRQGFLLGVLSFLGFLGGGFLGVTFASPLHNALGFGNAAVFGLVFVFLAATIGQIIATAIGMALRKRILWNPIRVVDSIGGAAISVISVLLVAWLVGSALANSSVRTLTRQVNHSAILKQINAWMPSWASTLEPEFRRLLSQNGFPQVFGGIGSEHIVPVAPPDPRVANSRAVRLARPDIVKVTGVAPSCSRRLEGSGFLYAPDHIMTNAHVVAGVQHPTVSTQGGRSLPATVVLFDPERDVAVLDVPGLGGTPLAFGGAAQRGQSVVVAGYPQDGPFRPGAGRIRDTTEARSPDIYQSHQVTRQIYSVYAIVRPGNSGGPLLDAKLVNGRPVVFGVVFAESLEDSHTGYALTAHEVAGDASAGANATRQVSTRGCDD